MLQLYLNKQAVVHKDYTLDYMDPLKRPLIETERGAGNLTYRYVYGLEKAHVVTYGVDGGAGSLMSAFSFSMEPDAAIMEYLVNDAGELEFNSQDDFFLSEITEYYDYGSGGSNVLGAPGGSVVTGGSGSSSGSGGLGSSSGSGASGNSGVSGGSNGSDGSIMSFGSEKGTNILKLYYHHDHLGSIDFLSINTDGRVISYVTYDDWGALTAKAVLKAGVRELDLVQEYTMHPMDMVLGVYYAHARMYDSVDRRWLSPDPL